MGVPRELIPASEPERLAALHRYEILDTPPDGSFDRLTAIAARHFRVPISIVTLVDHDRIWFKSQQGLPGVAQIDRVPGLCASAILQDDVWSVERADTDPRTLANPLVAGEFGLRFYAGAPLKTRDGHNLGTICVIDREPARSPPRRPRRSPTLPRSSSTSSSSGLPHAARRSGSSRRARTSS